MRKKRDAAYYRNRLRKDFPTIYSDLIARRLTSVRQAAAKAGLIRLPTRADELKRAWARATASERREFRDWLKAWAKGVGIARRPKTIVDGAGRLYPPVIAHLKAWLAARPRSRPGWIMDEMGFSRYDYRLAQAMGGYHLNPVIVPRLEDWLTKQGFWK